MKKNFILGCILGVVVLASFLFSQEYFFKTETKSEFIAVPGVAFHAETGERSPSAHNTILYDLLGPEFTYDGYVYPNGVVTSQLFAPIYFPEGAKEVRGLKARILDNEDEGSVQISLFRKDSETDLLETPVGVLSEYDDTYSDISTFENTYLSLDKAEIDNSRYSWFLYGHFIANTDLTDELNLQIHSVIIEYDKKLSKYK